MCCNTLSYSRNDAVIELWIATEFALTFRASKHYASTLEFVLSKRATIRLSDLGLHQTLNYLLLGKYR
jgi:hypothetical protein